ncbi:MAG: imidazole glycerol phosphate synthase subunit HisH [Burkholderiales bacterium]|nr:imidazole glycerol phosphate synthase subunit HisH [Flavobacterium sp.]
MKIVIIDYGSGNIQSLQFALNRLGYTGILTSNWKEIKSADRVIFPGVGAASNAMKKLTATGLERLIPSLKQPALGICLGMQLMCKSSEEGQTKTLGIFDSAVVKFTNQVKVPHMGWNQIFKLQSPLFDGIAELADMYFVHSFFVPQCTEAIATTHYDGLFASALQKDNFYGVQFHPEKSGKVGEQILSNFINLTQ